MSDDDAERCPTCDAIEGTGEGECAAEWGDDHPETETFSHDWAERCSKAEAQLVPLRALADAVKARNARCFAADILFTAELEAVDTALRS